MEGTKIRLPGIRGRERHRESEREKVESGDVEIVNMRLGGRNSAVSEGVQGSRGVRDAVCLKR